MKKGSAFITFANNVSAIAGRPQTFIISCLLILLWAASGPIFGYSDTWQLVINTSTTIITFLMVFVIQNTQNRDGRAIQIKLDELIRVMEGAHNALLDLEDLSEDELTKIRKNYCEIAKKARESLEDDIGQPDVNLSYD